ncbi:MAG: tryptophan-rich sensory protein [Pyrinomonadaceae bacterium]|nr:tryptophan-rich sensory protein [Pyrinomonadaceae bacterium]
MTLNKPNGKSLIFNIALSIGAVLVVNALIFGFGWNVETGSTRYIWFEPAGYVVGIVWVALFALMGTARWVLNFQVTKDAARGKLWIVILMISCLLYPLYALATGSVLAGFLGNIETVILSAFVFWRVRRASNFAAFLVAPVIVWAVFATFITLAGLNLI